MNLSPHKWYKVAFRADYLERYAHRDIAMARQEVEWIVAQLQPRLSIRLLDACCGAGRHMQAWREMGFAPMGFDLSQELLKEATGPRVCADSRHWPFAGSSFDLITLMFTSFGYFETDDENFVVLEELKRSLQPGGHFVLDLADADVVKVSKLENTVKELPGGTLSETRSLEGNRVVKDIVYETPTGVFCRRESVRMYDREEILGACLARGLDIIDTHEGFGEAAGRLIMIGTPL